MLCAVGLSTAPETPGLSDDPTPPCMKPTPYAMLGKRVANLLRLPILTPTLNPQLPGYPSAADDKVVLVEDAGLPRGDGALGFVKLDRC